ncbi:MAG: hypothetical protein KIT83_00950 [Bryobacterales bacterium]|nr:hypothetical protein [Bryobacterales bacterium]
MQRIIRDIAAGSYLGNMAKEGKPKEVVGREGTPVAITATHAALETNGKELLCPPAVFLQVAMQ